MTAYKDTLKCFIERTNSNLRFIQDMAINGKSESTFETTQLINSLLGLIVLPQQELFPVIPTTSYADLKKDGWPISFLKSSTKKGASNGRYEDNLNNLLRYFRNGIAHFNIEVTELDGQISGIDICDKNTDDDQPHWNACLTLDELEQIIEKFGEVINKHHP